MKELLKLLTLHGGKIVSSASCGAEEIRQSQASGRMFVDEDHMGYVWIPDLKGFPETDEEVKLFEMWYPLDIEMPEKLKNWKPKFKMKQHGY